MKNMAWVLTPLFSALLCVEQAHAGELWWSITSPNTTRALISHNDEDRNILYPGEYTLRITLYKDDLKCSLRVGTKSSNTNLLKISGPLAVSIKQARLDGFDCSATGTITVSNPPTAAVPVIMSLTYGPFLTKTTSFVIVPKLAITSVEASPNQLVYNRGKSVDVKANINRKFFASELPLTFMWRVREGKLCEVYRGSGLDLLATVEANTRWYLGRDTPPYYSSNALQNEVLSGKLCGSGRTRVEVTWSPWRTSGVGQIHARRVERQKLMADFSSKSVALNVSLLPSRSTSGIRSRGIDTQPPPIIPDPIPPALPNFELQGDKP